MASTIPSIEAQGTAHSSKHRDGGFFDTIPQDRVQTGSGERNGVATENAGGDILDFHDIEQAHTNRP